jgi:hypothetical protein
MYKLNVYGSFLQVAGREEDMYKLKVYGSFLQVAGREAWVIWRVTRVAPSFMVEQVTFSGPAS